MRTMRWLVVVIAMWCAVNVSGLNLPTRNITIWDTRDRADCPGIGVGSEDDEVEAATLGQEWDLEAFFWQDGKLWVVGGFNFRDGVVHRQSIIHAGDIFLDLNGDGKVPGFKVQVDPVTGLPVRASEPTFELFGWDLALAVSWKRGTFNVVQLNFTGDTTGSRVRTATMESYQMSNPYRYYDQGVMLFRNVPFEYGWVDKWPGLSKWGDTVGHYYGVFDLGSLGLSFRKVHMTMECGNDDLHGRVPDTGATLMLLGIALTSLVTVARKLT